mgnify:CR=1 FL=1
MATPGRAKGSKYASFKDILTAVATKDGMRKLMEEGKQLTPGACREAIPFIESMGHKVPTEVKEAASKAASKGAKAPPRQVGEIYEERVFIGRGSIPRIFLNLEPYSLAADTPVFVSYDKTGVTVTLKKPRG